MERNLNDWLTYLEQLHPQPIELGLDRLQQVAQRLAVTNFACPIITVGGTNGKGSCVALLQNSWLQAGYRVGAYTSPHLLHYTERITINGQPIAETDLLTAFAAVEQARQKISLTYFEFSTLAALWLFQQQPLDVIILEVGMGGRLDAVNCVAADVAVITSIDLDHCQWLGTTREAIGREKAGIFRPHRPAVIGDPHPPRSVLRHAEQLVVPLYRINQEFHYQRQLNHWQCSTHEQTFSQLPLPQLLLSNAATALQVISLLQTKLPTPEQAIRQALQHTQLPGRQQPVWIEGNEHIFDVAHNPAAVRLLAHNLLQRPCPGRTFAVIGMLADKQIPDTLKPLIPHIAHWYLGGLPEVPRGASATHLQKTLPPLQFTHATYAETVIIAYQEVKRLLQPADRIIISGSFHTVAAILTYLGITTLPCPHLQLPGKPA